MRHLLPYILATSLVLTTAGFSQPELDTSFASTGKRVINFGALANARGMVVQPDNKIVLVAPCTHMSFGSRSLCLVRTNEDGSLDGTFGASSGVPGSVLSNLGGTGVWGVALQGDGKIVLVGGGSSVPVVRYNPDGTIDSSFGGGDGVIVLDPTPSMDDLGRKVAIQPDGKIVVVGIGVTNPAHQFVARLLSDGEPDSSFGVGGIARTTIPGQITSGLSIALQADGKILAGGAGTGFNIIVRLNADGSPDNTWDGDSIVSIPRSGSVFFDRGTLSLAVRPDGDVVALGYGNFLYRFNSDGTLDPTFDADGTRAAMIGNVGDVSDMTVSAGGRITVVGTRSFPLLFAVSRFTANGSPDLTFSGDGYLEIDIDTATSDGARAVAVDVLGRTVIGGASSSCCVQNPFELSTFSAARLIAPVSAPVWISGRVTRSDGRPATNVFLTIRNAGNLVVGSAVTNPFGYYRFANIEAGQVYTISARSKGRTFTDRNLTVSDDVVNLDFVADP